MSDLPKTELIASGDNSITSPYYVSPSDNPGTVITPVLLNGENYSEWAKEIENALRAKRKICFIDGSLLLPSEPVEAEKWRTVNSMIVGWIRASIVSTVRSTVTFTADALKLWKDLQSRFSVGNAVRIYQLKAELAECRQEGSTVMEYFGRLSAKWEEILMHKPLPLCTCSAAEQIMRDYEEERVHQFLMGLDDARFGHVCTNIIGLDPLPNLNSVYQRVVREERRIGAARVKVQSETVGFVARTGDMPDSSAKSKLLCTHCDRSGHQT